MSPKWSLPLYLVGGALINDVFNITALHLYAACTELRRIHGKSLPTWMPYGSLYLPPLSLTATLRCAAIATSTAFQTHPPSRRLGLRSVYGFLNMMTNEAASIWP